MVEIPTLPDCVDNAAKNLTDKPTAAIGQTISELWQLVLGGRVSLAAEKQRLRYAQALEEYRRSLEEKVCDIPEDKQIEPSIQIAAQALEDSQYCIGTEELREMFANLISRSMHADYADIIHPSFSKIAQQLSPLDAQMLKIFYMQRYNDGIAIVDYVRRLDNGGFIPLMECVPELMPDNCSPESAARSVCSLQRLGLVEIPAQLYIMNPARYEAFRSSNLYTTLQHKVSVLGGNLDLIDRAGKLTVLGTDFVNVCLG